MLGHPKSRRLRRMIALGPEESFDAESTRAPTPKPASAAMVVALASRLGRIGSRCRRFPSLDDDRTCEPHDLAQDPLD